MKTPSGLLALNEAHWRDIACRLGSLAASDSSGALLTVTLPSDTATHATGSRLARSPAEGSRDLLLVANRLRQPSPWPRPRGGLHLRWPRRFTALRAAFNGIAQQWLHDAGGTDFQPFACIGFAFDDDSADVLPNAQLRVCRRRPR